MKEKTDLRIIKTKKILFDTLIKLMKQKTLKELKYQIYVRKLLLIDLPFMHIMKINMIY